MKYDCRFAIRESGIERERETVYIRRIYPPIHDMIRDYEKLEKSKIRHWFAVFGGSQSRNVASIFEILGNFHIVESHEADSIQFLFGLSPSEYWMLYIFEIPSFFFWGEKDPTRFGVIAPLLPARETLSGKWIILSLSWLLLNFITLLENILLDILRPTSSKNFPSRKFTF